MEDNPIIAVYGIAGQDAIGENLAEVSKSLTKLEDTQYADKRQYSRFLQNYARTNGYLLARYSESNSRFNRYGRGLSKIEGDYERKSIEGRDNSEAEEVKRSAKSSEQIYDEIEETANKENVWSTSYHSLTSVQKMLEKAVLLDTEVVANPSNRMGNNAAFVHHFYCFTENYGNLGIAKLYVVEDYTDSKKFYLTKISELSDSEGTYAPLKSSSNSDAYSVSDLYSLVKQYDKDFHPGKSVNPELLKEDGEPKIFYHGTTEDFTVFDNSNTNGLRYSKTNANWFTSSERVAKSYHVEGKIMQVYLALDNPLIIDAKGKWFYNVEYRGAKGLDKIANLAERRKYDGVIFKNVIDNPQIYGSLGESTVVAVFDSNRTKSAEKRTKNANIGTFSGSNDIRRSAKTPTTEEYKALREQNRKLTEERNKLTNMVSDMKREFEITKEYKVYLYYFRYPQDTL